MNQPGRFSRFCYRIIWWLVHAVYPKFRLEGTENLPEGGCILVGNHSHMYGPISAQLYIPERRAIWCAWQMMSRNEVAAYAYQDFWSTKPKCTRWFFKLLSHLITPLALCIFNNADTIPVFYDSRLVTTFKRTVSELEAGAKVVIFPECYEPHNQIVYTFRDRFVDVAKLYYKSSGKALPFVPMYIAPALRKIYFGKPVLFDPEAPIAEERGRIGSCMMDAVTEIGESLPEHVVVPYPNMSSRHYLTSRGAYAKKQPERDYRKLRPGNLTSPEFRHLLLLLGWVVYFGLYFLTENLIPVSKCYPVHIWLDDYVPFCEWFIIPYVGWYLLIIVSLLYFLRYSVESFKRMQTYIMITQAVAMICYIFFPTRQDLRPEYFTRDNILTRLIGFIYAFDTNTGVCPSLHVAYSLGIASTWMKEKSASRGVKIFVVLFVVVICISVSFVKQHSVEDIIAALPVGLLAEILVFGKSYYWKKFHRGKY